MIDSLCKEIELQKDYLENQPIETIYFGGGTPSLLAKNELAQILKAIHSTFDTSTLKEITLEANPDDISEEKVASWKELGINRLSIGLQSFKEEDLKWMNRAHTVEEANNCVGIAVKSGIPNITVDLIYGLPGLTNQEWESHIEKLVKMGVQHVSAYCLTVEKGTGLSHLIEKGKITPATEDIQAEQFLILIDILEKHNFLHYEISNFCKPGFESMHNSNYWKGVHYLGIGPSAHSYNGFSRSWNVKNNHGYMNEIGKGDTIWYDTEVLTKHDQFNEILLIGLRTIYGVDTHQLNEIIPLDAAFHSQIQQLCDDHLMEKDGTILRLTKNGRLQADRIASDLFRLKSEA